MVIFAGGHRKLSDTEGIVEPIAIQVVTSVDGVVKSCDTIMQPFFHRLKELGVQSISSDFDNTHFKQLAKNQMTGWGCYVHYLRNVLSKGRGVQQSDRFKKIVKNYPFLRRQQLFGTPVQKARVTRMLNNTALTREERDVFGYIRRTYGHKKYWSLNIAE